MHLSFLFCVLCGTVQLCGVLGSALLGNLQFEFMNEPLAIAKSQPRFSWTTTGGQESWQIVVLDSLSGTSVWNSGVFLGNTRVVVYSGSALQSDVDYTWTVTTTILGVGVVEASSVFSTAPAPAGGWIGGYDTLRASFALSDQPITRARLHVTAVGCYHLYFNGVRLSAELSPGFAHAPNVRVPYDTYDLLATQHLMVQGGENVVGMRIGSCKYGYIGSYCNGTALTCNAGWAHLTVTQGSNVTSIVTVPGNVTGSTVWTGSMGPILFQHLYHGESYDARLQQEGWNAPGFIPKLPWLPSVTVPSTASLGSLTPSVFAPIVRATSQAPVSIRGPRLDGSFVFDYGMNMAGHCTVNVSGSTGSVISMVHAEQLNADGSVRNTFVPCAFGHISDCANQTVNYTLAGAGWEVYTPHFCYAGFRYVQLWGWPQGIPSAASLVCHFTHTELAVAGSASFDPGTPTGALLNSLQASVVQTHLSNLVSLPTDCPQREKRGWTGDAQLTAHSAILNLGMEAFYENWHQTMLDQQRAGCGGAHGTISPFKPSNWKCNKIPIANLTTADYLGSIGDVVPQGYDGMGLWPGDASWEVAAILIPHELLEQYGDMAWLAETYDGPTASLAWFNRMATAQPSSNGLLPWAYLGDWIPIDRTSYLFVANFHYALGAHHAAEIAVALGHTSDAATFLALAALISDAFPRMFWNASAGTGGGGGWDSGSQCAQLLGLYLGLGGANYSGPALQALTADIAARGTHLSVGAAGARYLLQVLTTTGHSDTALALATSVSYPSWGYFLSETDFPGTMWEAWDWNATVYNESSGNHIFKAGGIGSWLYESALGLSFAHRLVPSHPDSGLGTDGLCACEAGLGMPYSLPSRYGLSCVAISAVCRVVNAHREAVSAGEGHHDPRSVWGLPALAVSIQKEMEANEETVETVLRPLLGMTIDLGIAGSIGGAAGWRKTPFGNASFAWSTSAGTVRVQAGVPCGVHAELEVPLALFLTGNGTDLVRAKAALGRGVILVNTGIADGLGNRLMEGRLAARGSAAARVDGRHMSALVHAPGADSSSTTSHEREWDAWVSSAAVVMPLDCGSHSLSLSM